MKEAKSEPYLDLLWFRESRIQIVEQLFDLQPLVKFNGP